MNAPKDRLGKHYLLCLALIAVAGCSSAPAPLGGGVAPPPEAKSIEGLPDYALGKPVSYGNVTLVPVLRTTEDTTKEANYISLAEAKKLGEVEISEMPHGKEVNRLYVRNLAKQPLLLLAGELLLGGDQDRVVGKDTVVPPGEEMAVPAYCVEHGRWEGRSEKFEYSGAMAPEAVRKSANFGGQQQVWDDVEQYNKSVNAAPATNALREGLSSKEVKERVSGDLTKFDADLDSQKNVVGLVYCVNGKIGTFELFGNERLLKASRDALLQGFLADAATQVGKDSGNPSLDEVAQFIKHSLTRDRTQTAIGRGQTNWSGEDKDGSSAESTLPGATTAKAAAPSQLLHGTYAPNDGTHRRQPDEPRGRAIVD